MKINEICVDKFPIEIDYTEQTVSTSIPLVSNKLLTKNNIKLYYNLILTSFWSSFFILQHCC